MSTLVIPAAPPEVPPLEARSSGSSMVAPVRGTGTTAEEVSTWALGGGVPADWEGDASRAATHAMTAMSRDLDVAVAVLHRVAGALDAYFDAIGFLEQRRADLVEEQSSLASRQRALATEAASYTEDEEAALRQRATTLQGEIDAFVQRVSTWQTDITRAEDAVLSVLQGSDTVAEAEAYAAERSAALDGLVDGLVRDGVLPAGASDMTAEELQEWLVANPEAAAALMERRPGFGDGGPAAELAALLGPVTTTPEGGAEVHEGRRQDARALFESLSAQDAALLAMLYPGVVGNLNGVPFTNRADANTVAVVDALADEQASLADLEERHEHNQGDWDFLGRNNDDLEGPIDDARARIELYESILSEDRQILFFDPSGDGAIAELHGEIGPDTRNVGVSVPGTGSDLASYQGVADRSNSFVTARPDGDLAMISWMGGDLPDGVVKDAPFANYARDLGPRLADFSHDVGLEIDHSAAADQGPRTTYMGHSYGGAVVGMSELSGLDADRVLHVASAGVGHDIDSPDDLPASQGDVDRYSMTAPGDFIEHAQGGQGTAEFLFGTPWSEPDMGHGADPDEFDGTVRLHTGDTQDGEPITGPSSHSGVFDPGSDSWRNMLGVLTGEQVTTYREPVYGVDPTGQHVEQTGWAGGETVNVP
jgi:hypothetical protein